jgi:RNase H-like domain found in reverse transcriptase/Integrase zinc binding domain
VLEVDASQYASGAILHQPNEQGRLRLVAYYSRTFNGAERNYNIHDRELLTMMRGLEHWRHLILSSPHKLTVISDHANLQYYQEAHRINRRVARYLPRMAEFDMTIIHRPGKTNKADPLSRPPGCDQGDHDHDNVVVLPPEMFVRLLTEHQLLQKEVEEAQEKYQAVLEELMKREFIEQRDEEWGTHWYHGQRMVVPEDPELHRNVLKMYHDHPAAGHPGITRTLALVAKDYWWPTMWEFVTNYVKGCAICQQTKSGTTKPRIPLMPITPKQANTPFTMVALDLITDLPESQGYDCVLTITDHDCSKAAIFTPCHKTIDSEGVAKLYAKEVFPHYGLPHRVISDRDPRFASKWTKELCRILGVDQNISTAYHPQTDGQSEHTNQWLEQYLRIYGNFQQNDWVMWLPMAQFVHNSWENETTKRTPFDLLMGHTPDVRKCNQPVTTPEVGQHVEWLEEKR